MRKTGTLVSWLVGGILVCACSSSKTHKDAGDSGTHDGAMSEVGESEVGEGEVGEGEVGASEVGGNEVGGVEAGAADAGVQAVMLTIGSGMRFTTPALVVPAGTTIMVENQDSVPHTVTSETAPDAFNASGAFDTGIITRGGTATITIPANTPSGTVYYYYCSIHTAVMSPPNGTITVQ